MLRNPLSKYIQPGYESYTDQQLILDSHVEAGYVWSVSNNQALPEPDREELKKAAALIVELAQRLKDTIREASST